MEKLLNYLQISQRDRKKAILVLIVVGVIIYLDFALVIKSQIRTVADTRSKISKLKKDIELLDKDLALLSARQKTQQPPKKIYVEGQIPLLLQEISGIANNNQIKVMEVSFLRDTKVKDKFSKPTAFIALIIELELVAEYHKLGSFLNQLENGAQPIFVEELKISNSPDDYLKQGVSLTLKTYVKK